MNPSVERIMLAKEYVPSQPHKNWPTTLVPLKNPVNLEKFAKAYQGEVISVSDSSAVLIGHIIVGLELPCAAATTVRTNSSGSSRGAPSMSRYGAAA